MSLILAAICHRCHWHPGQICHQCRLHRWCTLTCEYLHEFSKKFEMILMLLSGAWGKVIHEKNLKQKISWHCPFKAGRSQVYYSLDLSSTTNTQWVSQIYLSACAEQCLYNHWPALQWWYYFKNSKFLEIEEFVNALQGVLSMHTWNLLVFSGMPVPLCSLKLQMYQTTGQICLCESLYYGGYQAMMKVFSIISFALLVCHCYSDDQLQLNFCSNLSVSRQLFTLLNYLT